MKYTIKREVESQYDNGDKFIFTKVFNEQDGDYYSPRILIIDKVGFKIDSENQTSDDNSVYYKTTEIYANRYGKKREEYVYCRHDTRTQAELKNMIKRGELMPMIEGKSLIDTIYSFAGLCK